MRREDDWRAEFERFVSSTAGRFLRLAYLVVWDLGAAEDLVQECYAQVARRWPRVRAMERPDAYARRILFHLAIDAATPRRRHRAELVSVPDVPDSSTPMSALALRHDLLAALAHLAPRQRAVLALRYFADMTEAQTAASLGCSVGTVKSTAARAMERLRAAYDTAPLDNGRSKLEQPATKERR